jgi:hypothetical protein
VYAQRASQGLALSRADGRSGSSVGFIVLGFTGKIGRRPSLERLWLIQEVLYTTGILGSHCTVKGNMRILGMSQCKVKATRSMKETHHAWKNVLQGAQ